MTEQMSEQPAPRMLIVEDDDAEGRILEMLLVREGFSVQVSNDGVHGLAMAQQSPPDVPRLHSRHPHAISVAQTEVNC